MQVTSQTTVAAPIETVWDKLSNHVGMSQWGPGITVTMDRVGTDDPNGVGAIRRIASPGPAPDIVEEVVAFEAPNLLGYKALSGTPFPGYAAEVHLTPAARAPTSPTPSPPPPNSRSLKRRWRCSARCCSAFTLARPSKNRLTP